MANLKLDLVNNLNNEKYYEEIELIRLAQEPNMNYKEKIESMKNRLLSISMLNSSLGLVEQYFQEPVQAAPQAAPATPQAAPNGQSHAE